jgi:hypothetical protein
MNRVQVTWPSGAKQDFKDLPADIIYELKEGEAPKPVAPLPMNGHRAQ